jgi:hypothetical protein
MIKRTWAGTCALGIVAALSSPVQAKPYECGHWVQISPRIWNGGRGDILLTHVDDAPAGAVTGALGQYYTHTGILTSWTAVRHNTSILQNSSVFDDTLNGAMALIASMSDPELCYAFAEIEPSSLRAGTPGLATDMVTQLPVLKPWNIDNLFLLKPKDEGFSRQGALATADASESIQGMTYDVFAYRDYRDVIGDNRSMCSGAVKHATDLAGYGGFDLVHYSASEVNASAEGLYHYAYNAARALIEQNPKVINKPFHLPSEYCREMLASGVANEVVGCFADGNCARGPFKNDSDSGTYWREHYIGEALSISPDNLVYNQPNSLYGPAVRADWHGVNQYESQTCNDAIPQIGDYDGDGLTDFAVYRPSNGTFYVDTMAGNSTSWAWGTAGDIPVAGSWGSFNGPGTNDYAVWRANADHGHGTLFVWGVENRSVGLPGDIPVMFDIDGDHKAEFAVFRPTNGTWYYGQVYGPLTAVQWGAPGDVPVPGDYDGDGKDDLAVWRPSNGHLYIKTTAGANLDRTFDGSLIPAGSGGNWIAVPGDYDGMRFTQFALWNKLTGDWVVESVGRGSVPTTNWGKVGDIPVPGDYDGDGKTDFAFYRPGPSGTFFAMQSKTKTFIIHDLGTDGDVPVLARK